jgi:hypothetical protein
MNIPFLGRSTPAWRKLITMREALADRAYFGDLLSGDSWQAWRVMLTSIAGEELTEGERTVFESLTGRDREPGQPVEAFWGIIGRRGGKTRAMAVLSAYLAACVDYRAVLGPGERGKLPLMAANTVQARQAFDFIQGVFEESPALHGLVENVTADAIELRTRVDITVRPASHRTIRGITAVAAICDEMSSWYANEESANPAKEVLRALRPALSTTHGPLVVISTPRAKSGPLYDAFKRHYGPEGHRSILVARAPSKTMNPTLSQWAIDREFEEDPESAAAEYNVEWRGDLETFVDREIIERAITRGVTVRPPVAGINYTAFVDVAGGSGRDSSTLAIAHCERGRTAVLDVVLERRPPFSPQGIVNEFVATLRQYGIRTVIGNAYAAEWPREVFRQNGVEYQVSEKNKNDIYLNFLPLVNSGMVELLDIPKMVTQFCGLERRTARAGRDTVDHRRNEHDDIANAVAGALVSVGAAKLPIRISKEVIAWMDRREAMRKAAEQLGLPNPNIGPMRCFIVGRSTPGPYGGHSL